MPVAWPDGLNRVWAKSPNRQAGGAAETLVEHTWRVLCRLSELVHLRPDLPQAVGQPRLWTILFWAACLHDWGKAASGFQAGLRGKGRWPHRHEVLSLAFLDWLDGGLSGEEQTWVAAAIVSHHKDAQEILDLYPLPDEDDEFADPDQLVGVVAELDVKTLGALWRWLDGCAAGWIAELGLQSLGVSALPLLPVDAAVRQVQKQGAARIHQRLDAYHRWVKTLSERQARGVSVAAMVLRGTLINADHGASAHVGTLPHLALNIEAVLNSRHLTWDGLHAHQRAAAQTAGSALLTAPTGSGKTEAALLWAANQASPTPARLFYTLPYQASMNAMKLRLDETFGEGMVGLQHSRALLAIYRQLLEREDDPQQAAAQAKQMRNLAQLNHPPVRVLSPYQVLKSMYRLKGYEAMLSDYYDALFVLDEIHAYEAKRLALILQTIQYLAQHYRARFLIMSATFPTLIKNWLRQALDGPAEIVAEPALFERFQRHRLHLLDGELLSDEGLARIVADAQAGRLVLVVCNLVDRARTVYEALREPLAGLGVGLALLHGRFNLRDRMIKERVVREYVGAGANRAGASPALTIEPLVGVGATLAVALPDRQEQSGPMVLVATQAVEVSLDIDLDVLYSDPAPLEALVQRFGRVNRRGKKGLSPVYVYRQPDDGQHIYDPALIAGALRVLERENGQAVDESVIGSWLDEIYAGEIAARWQTVYWQTAAEFEATCVNTLAPFQADEQLQDQFYRAFDGLQVLPEALYDEFLALMDEDPILADELLVSISWGRYHALVKEGLILPYERGGKGRRSIPPVARLPYSAEMGLGVESKPREEVWWE